MLLGTRSKRSELKLTTEAPLHPRACGSFPKIGVVDIHHEAPLHPHARGGGLTGYPVSNLRDG